MYRSPLAVLAVLAAACSAKPAEKADSTTPPAAAPNTSTKAGTKADEDSIRAATGRVTAAFDARDTAAIVGLYADDGVDYTAHTPPARGRAELAKEYGALFGALKDLKMTMAPAEISVAQSGDLAASRSSYETTWTDAKGKAGKEHGDVVIVWRKVNGAWKMATSMNVADAPTQGA